MGWLSLAFFCYSSSMTAVPASRRWWACRGPASTVTASRRWCVCSVPASRRWWACRGPASTVTASRRWCVCSVPASRRPGVPALFSATGLNQPGKTVEYHVDSIGSSQVGMLYIVGNVSPNTTRTHTFRRYSFSLTAVIARKLQFVIFTLTQCLLPFYCVTQLRK